MNNFIKRIFLSALIFVFLFYIISANDDIEWKKFKKTYKKKYSSIKEELYHKKIFLANYKMIKYYRRNAKDSFEIGLNEFADTIPSTQKFASAIIPDIPDDKKKSRNITLRGPLPNYVNWVERGYNVPPIHQGDCGSCYVFSAIGALEAQYFIKTRSVIRLSQQDLLDCSKGGCNGGHPAFVFDIAEKRGVRLYKHAPYKAVNYTCTDPGNFTNTYVKISKHFWLNKDNDEEELKKIVATVGPVSAAIHTPKRFHWYRNGVFYDDNCNKTITHAILIVGYGTTNEGEDYWLIKNSWGTTWGKNGYGKIARNRNNHCRIASSVTYPVEPVLMFDGSVVYKG